MKKKKKKMMMMMMTGERVVPADMCLGLCLGDPPLVDGTCQPSAAQDSGFDNRDKPGKYHPAIPHVWHHACAGS